jgi:GTP cyclohydrolase II
MKKEASALIPTAFGTFNVIAYANEHSELMPHLAIVYPELNLDEPVLIRIHSECLTGDLLHSEKCDCGEQLYSALKQIKEKKGVLIYLRQEGRGIGLINKLKAYNLQEQGLNTIDANLHLGFQADERDYELAISIMEDLGIKEIDLLTNNPEKIAAIENSEIVLRQRIPLLMKPKENNKEYLETKQRLMGHQMDF